MRSIVHTLFLFFAHLGAFGLLILGVLDSSFLFLPSGNDLLLVALTAQHRNRWPYYVLMSTAGSTLGCLPWILSAARAEKRVSRSAFRGAGLNMSKERLRGAREWRSSLDRLRRRLSVHRRRIGRGCLRLSEAEIARHHCG